MPRETNVPYHQNVYDLLDLEPGVCPIVSRMIADHEAEYGPLPASVREWYCVPNMVPLERRTDPFDLRWQHGTLWFDYGNSYDCVPLPVVHDQFARLIRGLESHESEPIEYMLLKVQHPQVVLWRHTLDSYPDPPVYDGCDPHRLRTFDRFSEFTWDWFKYYHAQECTPISTRENWQHEGATLAPKPNENSLWLCTPATPYPIPVIDFLTEQLGEPTLRPVNDRVSQLSFATDDGLIRLTTDNLDHPNPHAAWWVAGQTPEAFGRLRDLLRPWNCFGPVVRTSADASS